MRHCAANFADCSFSDLDSSCVHWFSVFSSWFLLIQMKLECQFERFQICVYCGLFLVVLSSALAEAVVCCGRSVIVFCGRRRSGGDSHDHRDRRGDLRGNSSGRSRRKWCQAHFIKMNALCWVAPGDWGGYGRHYIMYILVQCINVNSASRMSFVCNKIWNYILEVYWDVWY